MIDNISFSFSLFCFQPSKQVGTWYNLKTYDVPGNQVVMANDHMDEGENPNYTENLVNLTHFQGFFSLKERNKTISDFD